MVAGDANRISQGSYVVVRCIGCGAVVGEPAADFRCTNCGDLLEVSFPYWPSSWHERTNDLKASWQQRKSSTRPLDAGGVWRFREVLPELDD